MGTERRDWREVTIGEACAWLWARLKALPVRLGLIEYHEEEK